MLNISNEQYNELVVIKANINVVELQLEAFMSKDLSNENVRAEMRVLLKSMSDLENEKANFLNRVVK
jgi:hypothetical protein|tara:strand:+ start:88 stop:288 length:201 start_codon:yes stop_codon:yes gene_type:complete